ncbi:hypothetical protein [Nocardia sp. NBC_00511]|uniref:hypothetical protein n=1 Tax=Nocardia sp. NBC_00511 TaxID=2903591 RepID=UPI0030E4DF9D
MTLGLLPSAVGFLRSDISGTRREHDERQIERTARLKGYDLRKTVVFSENTIRKNYRLRIALSRAGVDTVIVPSLEHFDGQVPAEVVAVADIVTISPENTYARTGDPSEAAQ